MSFLFTTRVCELLNKILCGDAIEMLRTLPNESVDMCVTSPPYYRLRDYSCSGQIGLEPTIQEYIDRLTDVFRELKRVLKNEGTLWLNIGDSYAGQQAQATKRKQGYTVANIKSKDMLGIPWLLAFALRDDGWYLRSDIIWQKTNAMPESVTDRPTQSYEHIFLLAKSTKYFYNHEAIKEPVANGTTERLKRANSNQNKYSTEMPGQSFQTIHKPRENMSGKDIELPTLRQKRDVWSIATSSFKGMHYATFPLELASECIKAGCPCNGTVIDPFFGSGTTGIAALKNERQYIGIDLNKEYCHMSHERIENYLSSLKEVVGK